MFTQAQIAQVVHEANRALQAVLGEAVSEPWGETPQELRDSVINGVVNAQGGASPEESHDNWLRYKEAQGWTYGPVKDFDAKTHPCMVPYEELPAEQRAKDALFVGIVRALS